MHVSPVLPRLSVQPPCRGAGDMADREVVPTSLFMWNREHSARIRRGVTLPEWRPGKGADFEGHWGPPLTGGTPLNGAGPQGLCLTDGVRCQHPHSPYPVILRPAAWVTPEASTLVRYSNGGCPWCVHFIYDEYYMANLLSVLNSSWEHITGGVSAGTCPW